MTTEQYKKLAKRLTIRGIEAYKTRLIYEENLLNGEDKRHVLNEIDAIKEDIKFDKIADLEKQLAESQRQVKTLQEKLNWLHSIEDCDEEFEL